MTLDKLENGNRAIVLSINNESDLKRRLMDIGVVPGSEIERLCESPFGDPVAFVIKGAVIALRNETSKYIYIK